MNVYDMSLMMMRHVTDMLHGSATGGSTTTLIDTGNLDQDNEYWTKGTLWIKSGDHAGKVFKVTGHVGNTLTFATVVGAIAAGVRYSVARGLFPWEQQINAIQQALDLTWVTGYDGSLSGDGSTLEFTLPAGVSDVYDVRLGTRKAISTHWVERQGKLVFESNRYAPYSGDVIHVYHQAQHDELTGYSSEIDAEINPRWLQLEAAKNLLVWAASRYQKKPDLMLEERINLCMNGLKGKPMRLGGPVVRMKSGSAGVDRHAY